MKLSEKRLKKFYTNFYTNFICDPKNGSFLPILRHFLPISSRFGG